MRALECPINKPVNHEIRVAKAPITNQIGSMFKYMPTAQKEIPTNTNLRTRPIMVTEKPKPRLDLVRENVEINCPEKKNTNTTAPPVSEPSAPSVPEIKTPSKQTTRSVTNDDTRAVIVNFFCQFTDFILSRKQPQITLDNDYVPATGSGSFESFRSTKYVTNNANSQTSTTTNSAAKFLINPAKTTP